MPRFDRRITIQDFKAAESGSWIAEFALPVSYGDISSIAEKLLTGARNEAADLRSSLVVARPKVVKLNQEIKLYFGFGSSSSVQTDNVDIGGFDLGLFGPMSRGHGLALPPLTYGSHFTEPSITRGIHHACTGGDAKVPSHEVKAAFLQALFSAAGIKSPDANIIENAKHAETKQEKIVKRKHKKKRNFIDLWFEWDDELGRHHIVVVEAKIHHKESKGQLKVYRAYAQKVAKNNNTASLNCFFLTIHGELSESAKERENWWSISWFDVLRRWEALLHSISPHKGSDFQRFRSELWRQTFG